MQLRLAEAVGPPEVRQRLGQCGEGVALLVGQVERPLGGQLGVIVHDGKGVEGSVDAWVESG